MQDLAAERAFYDELFRRNPENEHITAGYRELHDLAFPTPPAGRTLDLGCGTGAHSVRLAQRGHDVVAVDLSVEGIHAARERFRLSGLRGRFLVADAQWLPFRDRAMAATWSSLLLHHFPNLDRLPDELARVTSGRLVALEPNAQNLLSWFAFNVVNRFVGLSTTTRNQRALFPGRLHRRMSQSGFRVRVVRYVHLAWQDGRSLVTLVRRVYEHVARLLPDRWRANKFLVVYEKDV